ncbi:hypothetical protein Sipo8835_46260 [Streptomyces ipomoeae]|uniref:Uncharacterized protein n=1 Tax=Streptomyces ipomoeae TaxID=103232 RepID=A0AAE8VSN2_9ACTN|nr:hypothetical protein [Streptomyces ipomoeae]TQE15195.1 hypothetical protein Sipo8835_46260 [Streptomyces ipomoeae]
MAKYATGDDPAKVGPYNTYFTQDEAFWLKKTAIGLSHSVTLIKGDVEFIKGSLTALAVGVTAIKADFTLVKMDEKGMTVFGRQKFTWPWVGEKKRIEERLQRAQDKALKKEEEVKNKLTELRTKLDSMQQKRNQVGQLTRAAGNSPDGDRLRQEAFSLRAEIGKEKAKAQKLRDDIEEELEKINKKRTRIVQARRELRDLATASSASDKAREQISKNANAARRELALLNSQL